MKVIFIYPDESFNANWKGYYYHGIGYLSAVLKNCGHKVDLVHLTGPISRISFLQKVARVINNSEKFIFAISTTTNKFPSAIQKANWLKKAYSNFIIFGGVHPTLCPDTCIEEEAIDAICRGDGEVALSELCSRLEEGREINDISNLWVKSKGKIYRNPVKKIETGLDSLPFPDRDIFDYRNLALESNGVASIMAKRGCPYDCSYCSNHALALSYDDKNSYVRFRSVSKVIEEIKKIRNKYNFIKELFFEDDVMFLNKEWSASFIAEYNRQIKLPFTCNMHPLLVTGELVKELKKSGCYMLHLGVESGSESIRYGLLNRKITQSNLLNAIGMCRNSGIQISTYNIVGFPGETAKDMLDTVKLNASIRPKLTQCTIFYPFPGTRLSDFCRDNNLLSRRNFSNYLSDTPIKVNFLQRERIKFFSRYFYFLVLCYAWLGDNSHRHKYLKGVADRLCIGKSSLLLIIILNGLHQFIRNTPVLEKALKRIKTKYLNRQ